MKYLKYFLISISLIFLVGCNESEYLPLPEVTYTENIQYIVNPTYEILQGLWGGWNENGNFEFFDIMDDVVAHGEISPDGDVIFLNIGAYHFHGNTAHSLFQFSIDENGASEENFVNLFFAPLLSSDTNHMRVEFMDYSRVLYWEYLGQDPNVIDEIIGASFFGDYTYYEIVERLLWSLVVSLGLGGLE